MIAAAHFRRGPGDREPIAAPGESTSIAATYTPSQQAWGKVTSRQPDPASRAALELAAFRMGIKPASLAAAIRVGLVNG
jgi:hypothetical protein